jgi:hypothetical protein
VTPGYVRYNHLLSTACQQNMPFVGFPFAVRQSKGEGGQFPRKAKAREKDGHVHEKSPVSGVDFKVVREPSAVFRLAGALKARVRG